MKAVLHILLAPENELAGMLLHVPHEFIMPQPCKIEKMAVVIKRIPLEIIAELAVGKHKIRRVGNAGIKIIFQSFHDLDAVTVV